jgi:hypothetical protein
VSHPLEHKPFGMDFGIPDPAGQTQYVVAFTRDRRSKTVG